MYENEDIEEFVNVLERCGMLYGMDVSNEEFWRIYENEVEFVKKVNELGNMMIEVVCMWNEVVKRLNK